MNASDIGIDLEKVSISIPVYNARGRSLRSAIMRQVGAGLTRDADDVLRVEALRDMTLSLRPGDRLGLVGHNGAGKSTLLRVLAGAYEPSSGRASIKGRVAALLDISLGLEPELTGRENIALRAACLGLTRTETKALEPWIEDFCELGEFMDIPLRTYSSGMALRLAFGISTAAPADILLLDEIISVGDAGFAERATARMQELMNRAAILVLASHDESALARWCNRRITLERGKIVAEECGS